MEKEIIGYRLNGVITKQVVNALLQYQMPNWYDNDKSVYFLKGHIGGSLVKKLRDLKVFDLWFSPIYNGLDASWLKKEHIDYYTNVGIMSNKDVYCVQVIPKITATKIEII